MKFSAMIYSESIGLLIDVLDCDDDEVVSISKGKFKFWVSKFNKEWIDIKN